MKGNTVGGAHTREYGVVRIRISPSGTVHFILLHSHDVQYRLSV